MIKSSAKIELVGKGGNITVDGRKVHNVRSLEVLAEAGKPPVLLLELRLGHVEVDGEMCVSVPQQTYDALVQLGWSPPLEAELAPETGR